MAPRIEFSVSELALLLLFSTICELEHEKEDEEEEEEEEEDEGDLAVEFRAMVTPEKDLLQANSSSSTALCGFLVNKALR